MWITDFSLSYSDKDEGPLDHQSVYASSGIGTTYCIAPEVLHNRSNLSYMEYGASANWWALGCVIYELVLRVHKAHFVSSFIAILLVSSFQALFTTKVDTLSMFLSAPAIIGYPNCTLPLKVCLQISLIC